MSQPFIHDYLQKLLLLEDKVGAKVGYQLFEPPSHFNPYDSLALNRTARDIARFAGLQDLVTVATTAHPKDCAAHIDLADTHDGVFVEIATDILDFPNSVLGTLAHEISHRFLHFHGLSCGQGPEFHHHNEILTDITGVFLGLGKLMVNGCTGEKKESTPSGVVTHRRTVGYLEPRQLTVVYLLVCAMRGIARAEYERRLVSTALDRVRECHANYESEFFSESFRGDAFCDELQAKIDRAKSEGASKLSVLEDQIRELQQNYLAKTSGFLRNARTQLAKIVPLGRPTSYDPAFRFLTTVSMSLESSRLIEAVSRLLAETEKHERLLSDLVAVASGNATVGSHKTGPLKRWFRRRGRKQSS